MDPAAYIDVRGVWPILINYGVGYLLDGAPRDILPLEAWLYLVRH